MQFPLDGQSRVYNAGHWNNLKSTGECIECLAVVNEPFLQISRRGYWKENLEILVRQIKEVHEA